MKRENTIRHEFVEFIPEVLQEGTIYVSITYATAAHKCCCGCGKEVVTPISPTDWKLIFDGVSISLDPSIGNWNFVCRSHYWIRNNRVAWAASWSEDQIDAGRAHDSRAKKKQFIAPQTVAANPSKLNSGTPESVKIKQGLWQRLKKLFRHK